MYGEEERPDRFGTKEDTNVWIEYIAKSVKEPTMRINLFRVLFFKTEEHLNWNYSLISTL
ncbi:hypothetical protein GLOIN_2v1642952, partial [Rhizophagus irregularis DAOM 181602=DAOM 197198]